MIEPSPVPRRKSPVRPWPALVGVATLALILGALILGAPWGETHDHGIEVAQARADLRLGRPDLAARRLAPIRDQDPGAAEALTLLGQAYLLSHQRAAARRTLERALRLKPDQADALKMLAALYLTYSDAARAIKLLDQAAQLDPHDFRPWYALGKAHAGQGGLDQAIRSYEGALSRDPPPAERREIELGLAKTLLDAGRAEDAGPILTAARRDLPTDPRLLGLAARQARETGEADRALTLADQTLSIDPDNLDALLTRARSHQLAGRPAQALLDLDQAAALAPADLGTLQLKLQVESQLGRSDRTAETSRQINQVRERQRWVRHLASEISRLPDDPGPRWKLGQVAVAAGQPVLAAQCFQAALDLDPTCQPARAGLARLAGSVTPPPRAH